MLTYIGFAERGVIDGNSFTLDRTFILVRLRHHLTKRNAMIRAKTTAAAAIPPMAGVLRPSLELEENRLSALASCSEGQRLVVQLVLLEVGVEGV